MSDLITPSLLWFIFGCVLLFIEMLTPALIIFFFGFGAWVAAVFAAYTEISFNAEIIVFIVSSLIFLALLRSRVKKLMNKGDSADNVYVEDDFTGRVVQVLTPISPTQSGKVNLNGSQWTATSHEEFAVGDKAYIVGKTSITFHIQRAPLSQTSDGQNG